MTQTQEKKSFLAMYDVRGIQNYIFKTNKMQEIIGASRLVENIIIEGLDQIIAQNGWGREHFLTQWEKDEPDAFLSNENILMQVLFIGGGNAYVLFRGQEILRKVNRALAKYVLEETWSLNLAVAVVEKSRDYQKDYEAINLKMREIKAGMPETRPVGAMPFMAVDPVTGYPLTTRVWRDKDTAEYICTEAALKRARFSRGSDNAGGERILDNMVTEKGESSLLAAVHIDGNNMGARIRAIMEDRHDYADAVIAMRTISGMIRRGFRETFDGMGQMIDEVSDRIKPDREGKLYREILVAGDDITFVCNARAAIPAVEWFLEKIAYRTMYVQESLTPQENRRLYGFSACAGIAFFNSHFPFTDAYQVAEECCGSAKARAKLTQNRSGGQAGAATGSYLDYQICPHIRAADLKACRTRQYLMPDGSGSMVRRPYYVPSRALEGISDLNERNRENDIQALWSCLSFFQSDSERGPLRKEGESPSSKGRETGMTRSRAKRLRNAYALGMEEVEKYCAFLASRDVIFPEDMPDRRFWYDALEIMDFCPGKEENRDEAQD